MYLKKVSIYWSLVYVTFFTSMILCYEDKDHNNITKQVILVAEFSLKVKWLHVRQLGQVDILTLWWNLSDF